MSLMINKYDETLSDLTLDSNVIDRIENILKKLEIPRNSSNTSRCGSCRKKAFKFYCGTCINNKNISHSKENIKLADKYRYYLRAQEKINKLEGSSSYFYEKTKEQRLKDEINKIKEDITEAKKKLEKRNAEKSELISTLLEENEAVTYKKKKLQQFDYRFNKFMTVLYTVEKSAAENKLAMEPLEKLLRKQVKYQVSQVLDILPVTLFSPDNVECDKILDVGRLLTYIEEGANTSYMRGEWEFTHQHEFEAAMGKVFTQYLPADGNYFDFYKSNKDKKDACFDVSVGLYFLVQFISLIAHYCDVILPRPMQISDFNDIAGVDFKSLKFQKMIYNLNANIFHLCLSQCVPAKYLHPHRAIPNVIALMYHPSVKLGRFNPIIDLDNSANEYLEEVEVEDFPDTDDEQNDFKSEADGWEKLTPSI